MTFGYFVGDVENIFTIVYGSLQSKNICSILQRLAASMDDADNQKLQRNVQKMVLFMLVYNTMITISHTYVTFERKAFTSNATLFSCSSIGKNIVLVSTKVIPSTNFF